MFNGKNFIKKVNVIMIIFLFLASSVIIPIDAKFITRDKIKTDNVTDNDNIFSYISKNNFLDKASYKNLNEYIDQVEFVPGEIIVKLREDIKTDLITDYNHLTIGIQSIDVLNKNNEVNSVSILSNERPNSFLLNVYKFTLNKNTDILSVVEQYRKDPNVVYAEPNYIFHTQIVPDDPLYPIQWSLDNIGQDYPYDGRFVASPGKPDSDIDAPEAWDIETGNSSIVVAILDTGVDYTHPDLVDNIWINEAEYNGDYGVDDDNNGFIDDIRGWDFERNNSNPMDTFGHGTHCAGTVSATTNNGIGVAGVCWNCKIMAVRIGGYGIELEDAVNGIKYAVDNGADVISMSWGGIAGDSQLLQDAIDYAYDNGVILVAAAGNSNVDLAKFDFIPAGYDNVIAVAATDSSDKKANFSCYGSPVDVAAPGVDILSLRGNNTDMYEDGSHIVDEEYYVASGTSMAGPHVAGLAALILSENPDLNAMQVRTILRSSTDKIDSTKYAGVGRINAHKALQKSYPVIVDIDPSVDVSELKGSIEIKGTAIGEGFQQYYVEYGMGAYPDNWIEICNSTESVENDFLATWNSTSFKETYYTIRLKVVYDFGVYEDRTAFLVNNIKNTIYVDDDNSADYNTIEMGVDNAGTDDTVYVFNGTYNEEIIICKAIQLTGENKASTEVSSSFITFNLARCEGLTVSGFTISGWVSAIWIQSNNVTITDNIIKGSPWPQYSTGIIVFTSGNILSYNTIINNSIGISFIISGVENNIHHNNFIDNLIHIQSGIMAFSITLKDLIKGKYSNNYDNNYWDDWIGLKYRFCKRLPKRIENEIFGFKKNGLLVFFLWYDYDKHPVLKPYEYEGGI